MRVLNRWLGPIVSRLAALGTLITPQRRKRK